jgi:hypothetical protein
MTAVAAVEAQALADGQGGREFTYDLLSLTKR